MGNRAVKEVVPQKPRWRIAAHVDLSPGTSPGTLKPVAGSASATVSVLSVDDDRTVTPLSVLIVLKSSLFLQNMG
jgi:hypothetical protein